MADWYPHRNTYPLSHRPPTAPTQRGAISASSIYFILFALKNSIHIYIPTYISNKYTQYCTNSALKQMLLKNKHHHIRKTYTIYVYLILPLDCVCVGAVLHSKTEDSYCFFPIFFFLRCLHSKICIIKSYLRLKNTMEVGVTRHRARSIAVLWYSEENVCKSKLLCESLTSLAQLGLMKVKCLFKLNGMIFWRAVAYCASIYHSAHHHQYCINKKMIRLFSVCLVSVQQVEYIIYLKDERTSTSME